MERYTKRPVTIEAERWDGTARGATPIIDWALSNGGTIRYNDNPPILHGSACRCDGRGIVPCYQGVSLVKNSTMQCPETEPTGGGDPYLEIDTLEGTMRAAPTDYVIRGVKGEFYSCRGDIFEETYLWENGDTWHNTPMVAPLGTGPGDDGGYKPFPGDWVKLEGGTLHVASTDPDLLAAVAAGADDDVEVTTSLLDISPFTALVSREGETTGDGRIIDDDVPWTDSGEGLDVMTRRLYATDDAMVWAEAWCETAAKILDDFDPGATSQLIDAGWMVGWFANAMEIAKSLERDRLLQRVNLAVLRAIIG